MSDLEFLDKSIRRVHDFPKPGILFYDITGVLVNPPAFKFCLDTMEKWCRELDIDAISGIKSRGFLFAKISLREYPSNLGVLNSIGCQARSSGLGIRPSLGFPFRK